MNATTPPATRDALFGLEPPAKPAATAPADQSGGQAPPAEPTGTRDALFGLDTPGKSEARPAAHASIERPAARDSAGPRGYLQTELAYTYGAPEHWSKTMLRLHVGTGGQQGAVKWKASARLDYNPVYDLTDVYPKPVRDAERVRLHVHETYLDFTTGDWEWRVGRQNIVWGEMVGLFFADVVSAKDLREFVLPDFQIQRIPQWAVRAERFGEDWHTEFVWIPYPSYDLMGKPGGDFYPLPPLLPGFAPVIEPERKPARTLKNASYGVRVARLIDGWDLSAFYYNSLDATAVFPRELTATTQTYRPRHERIWQAGGTLGKDLRAFVLKAELIYTDGRRYNLKVPTTDDGLIEQDTLDWVIGADFQLESDTRLNAQLFQRLHFDHDPRIVAAEREHGVTLLVSRNLGRNWEAEALFIRSLNRNDWLLRPKLTWKFLPNWRLTTGVDVLHGPMTGLFGRFSNRDRIYAEIRHDF
ncbi:MAG: DUF1302 family protein [Burkholderiales bacterium]|nr:DUF1302 family protein [Burkholderiales bacterium]